MGKGMALLLVLVLAMSGIVTFFLFQGIVVNNENEVNKVKIADFSVMDFWGNPVGMTFDCWFNLTIHNEGINNVSGLVLDVKVFINNSEVKVSKYFLGISENDTVSLDVGEVKEFQGAILAAMGSSPLFETQPTDELSIKAIVMLNNVVLDEQKSALRMSLFQPHLAK